MVETVDRPADPIDESSATRRPRPMSASDMRALIPDLGLIEYWYPALEDKKVKNKPVGVKICGTDLVFFRGGDGQVKCLWNVCPHRGGSLMHGDCHYEGTISCPYHGWTYDGDGNVLAVLPEGPDSQVPGKVKARKYPTETRKGMVFVWMGEGEPVPIEEDVPPEFFDDITTILFHTEYWPVQWNLALENGGDAHVPYVHRNSFRQLQNPMMWSSATGSRQKIVNGRAVVSIGGPPNRRRSSAGNDYRKYFPLLDARWPKHSFRLWWTWIWSLNRKRVAKLPPWDAPEEWASGHHLPGMYRGDHRTDLYTRNCIPVTEKLSRQIYYKAVRPKNWIGRVYERVFHRVYWRWAMYINFSSQDFKAVSPQRYDTPEHLSATDLHQVYWRRLVLQARGMKRPEEVEAIPRTEAEDLSFRYMADAEAYAQSKQNGAATNGATTNGVAANGVAANGAVSKTPN